MTCSGASGFLSVLLCCALFCTSGHYLHRALDLMPATAAKTYPDLGAATLGPPGRHLVSVAAATGLFGSSCLPLVVLWRSVAQLLAKAFEGSGASAAAVHSAALLCGIATEVPLCVLGSYRTLSGFSTLGCVSTAAVIALVAVLPILDPQRRYLDAEPAHHAISIDFVTATSVFAVRPPFPRVARGAVVAAVVAIALCLNRVLAGIESVDGAVCAITTCLLLPTVFCAALRRRAGLLRPRHWAAVGGMGVFGVVLMPTVLGRTAMQVIVWLRGDAHSHHDATTAR
eukprot:jgi/Ulvmu1/6396/UM003_0024.1